MFYNINEQNYLVNLIDSPGHVDFSSEVTAALRVSDGSLVVVDYIEGVCVQTETVLRQSLLELIRPVLVINKVDRAIFELKQDPEAIYNQFQKVIDEFNTIVSTYQKEEIMGDCQVDPVKGQVCFGSAIQGWGFTLNTISNIYSSKFGTNSSSFINKLWGHYYYDTLKSKITTEPNENTERTFCYFALSPIIKLCKSIMAGDKEVWMEILSKLKIKVDYDENLLVEKKKLLVKMMQSWIDVADAVIDMMILNLPSPNVSQKYRIDYLYEGPLDDKVAKSMKACDQNGEFMMYVSKMIPTSFDGRFMAFGRVFSGVCEKSKKIRVLGPNFKQGSKEDLYEKTISKVVLMVGKKEEEMAQVP